MRNSMRGKYSVTFQTFAFDSGQPSRKIMGYVQYIQILARSECEIICNTVALRVKIKPLIRTNWFESRAPDNNTLIHGNSDRSVITNPGSLNNRGQRKY